MSVTMQKFFARILVIIIGIFSVFTGGNPENIKLELKNEVTTETEIIEVAALNYTGRQVSTGEGFTLEKNTDGEWVELKFAEDFVVNEIATIIRNLQTVTFSINVVKAFGKTLDEGEYRLTKEFLACEKSVIFNVTAA